MRVVPCPNEWRRMAFSDFGACYCAGGVEFGDQGLGLTINLTIKCTENVVSRLQCMILRTTREGSNRLFKVRDLYWRARESGDLRNKSRQLKKTICSCSEGWWVDGVLRLGCVILRRGVRR